GPAAAAAAAAARPRPAARARRAHAAPRRVAVGRLVPAPGRSLGRLVTGCPTTRTHGPAASRHHVTIPRHHDDRATAVVAATVVATVVAAAVAAVVAVRAPAVAVIAVHRRVVAQAHAVVTV